LPQALQDQGGWQNRETCSHFARYARIVFEALGDQVGMWITHNEPWVVAFLGHASGHHAPGIVDPSNKIALQVSHHLLLSHGMAVREYRNLKLAAPIGITLNMAPIQPATDSPADQAAAERAHQGGNDWFARPVLKGEYPAEIAKQLQAAALFPATEAGDMDLIALKTDFLGINIYFRQLARHDENGGPGQVAVFSGPGPRTRMDWEVYPPAMHNILKRISSDYPDIDLYITENGAAFEDSVVTDSEGKRRVHDDRRLSYIQEHLKEAHALFTAGVRFKGYFAWSLLDNFEWAFGFDRRFGIVHVDFDTQQRTLKDSALWYAQVIKNKGM
ncbi:MAG: family 1 glycosylhydrolase, partial [Spirochaetes bacterium]|nr:family 1 glycosylhydrolase [Spirochaetota bacterium]